MRFVKILFLEMIVSYFCVIEPLQAQTGQDNVTTAQPAGGVVVDKVAAVVGSEIILLSEVQQQFQAMRMQQNIDENTPQSVIERFLKDILKAMIDERLLLVKAAKDSIKIDTTVVGDMERERLQNLKTQFKTNEGYAQALQEYGITEPQLRDMIRRMMVNQYLQEQIQQTVMRSVTVTPQDMETWVVANKDSLPEMPTQYRVSHILIYPRVADTRKAEIRNRLAGIRQQIIDGADFGEMAKKYSEDPGSKASGGDLGFFSKNEMVEAFSNVVFNMQPGQMSDIIETQFGFHIIKLEEIRGEQAHARHILLLMQTGEADNAAIVAQLDSIRNEIITGKATFEDMAKKYSEDVNSKDLGGKLQWLTVDQGIPSFMEQAAKLEIGGISEPFKSQYGYHLLKLENYRQSHTVNVKDDSQYVRQMVQYQKTMTELDRILEKLRVETYIRVSLE
jgi:peptidyl-prolyl cis-trans isomerase SurA